MLTGSITLSQPEFIAVAMLVVLATVVFIALAVALILSICGEYDDILERFNKQRLDRELLTGKPTVCPCAYPDCLTFKGDLTSGLETSAILRKGDIPFGTL